MVFLRTACVFLGWPPGVGNHPRPFTSLASPSARDTEGANRRHLACENPTPFTTRRATERSLKATRPNLCTKPKSSDAERLVQSTKRARELTSMPGCATVPQGCTPLHGHLRLPTRGRGHSTDDAAPSDLLPQAHLVHRGRLAVERPLRLSSPGEHHGTGHGVDGGPRHPHLG